MVPTKNAKGRETGERPEIMYRDEAYRIVGACFVGNPRVVDLGCGMGVLSVAARQMGMRVVAGVDVNPSALVQAVKRNADRFPEDFMFQPCAGRG
jgi:predicted RNA methylase